MVGYLPCINIHATGEEYKLFWPEQSEFVRMAARFGAKIVPFGVVGEDDIAKEVNWRITSLVHEGGMVICVERVRVFLTSVGWGWCWSGSMICWCVIIWDVLGVCWPKGYNGILGGWSIREFCGEGWNEGYAERSWKLVLKLMRILKELMAEE
ncbi:hypothetical protein HanRHA438_Chr09g0403341 [Helianthus annuus]|nr:hypothetical protein HanRHA438_Chr09g0403341 [Helianthus annuus]